MSSPVAYDPPARALIAQIYRDIAAAWEQVEAGREILRRSAWLLARWRELDATPPPLIPEQRASAAGMLVFYEPVPTDPRRAHVPRPALA
jgi:hypothetical protein